MAKSVGEIANEKKLSEFVPMQEELIQLVKYWVRKAIDGDYFIFWGQCVGGSALRRVDFAWQRVNDIPQIAGKDEKDGAVIQAYEDAAQECERSHWIVFCFGTREERTLYQDQGGQCLWDFASGVSEEIARSMAQRVLSEGKPEKQQALIKDELGRYARKLHRYKRVPGHSVEILGIHFPAELRRLILSTGVNDPDPQPNEFYGAVTPSMAKLFWHSLMKQIRRARAR
jgi:hypothetical protein